MKNDAIKAIENWLLATARASVCRATALDRCRSIDVPDMLAMIVAMIIVAFEWMLDGSRCAYMGISRSVALGLSAGCVKYAMSELVVPTVDNTVAGYLQCCDSKYNLKRQAKCTVSM